MEKINEKKFDVKEYEAGQYDVADCWSWTCRL